MDFFIKKGSRSIAFKIIVTCILACVATLLSLYISRFTFTSILSTVDKLSKPNTKIQLVNSIFLDVVKLDQHQRTQALKTKPTEYSPFLNESHLIQVKLDSLHSLSLQNKDQVIRIDSMKKILYQRDLLFLKYIKLRTAFVNNDTVAEQVRALSAMIEKAQLVMDSSIVTTTRDTKIIIDTLESNNEKTSLWNRVFVKKKPRAKQVQRQIQEELQVRVDTLAVNKSNDSIAKMGSAISRVESNRLAQRKILVKHQEEINLAGASLVGQLINILNHVENEELAAVNAQNKTAKQLVSNSLRNISIVLVIFVLATAFLVFFIFTDISKSNRYRRELIAAKEEAEEAGLVKQRFLANMSHELRTPLQTIIGLSEQIRDERYPRPQAVENIYLSSLYLLQIVNEVLDYSRIISGKFMLEQSPFSMYGLLSEVKEMIQVQAGLKKLQLLHDTNVAENSYYSGDQFRLKQILLNLLGNAVKFTDKGSVSVSVRELQNGPGISVFTFTVKDTGPGISKEDLAVIFNQFEQGSNLNRKQGTGLGLSIVKALVDIQDGTLEVNSTPGDGTTFTVTIPYAHEQAPETTQQVQRPPNANNQHIWVVDDDVFILQLCDNILNKYGIAHTIFSTADEVLATPFPNELSVVFMDIRMPGTDGITLCNLLKQRQDDTEPKYVALTAQAMPDERQDILNKGFDGLVMKPFLEQDLLNAIDRYGNKEQKNITPVIDLTIINKMTGGDKDLLAIALGSFVTETQKDIDTAHHSISINDHGELAESFHRLAGRCGQVGATTLAQQARTIEIKLHGHASIEEMSAIAEALLADLHTLVMAIKELQKSGDFPA